MILFFIKSVIGFEYKISFVSVKWSLSELTLYYSFINGNFYLSTNAQGLRSRNLLIWWLKNNNKYYILFRAVLFFYCFYIIVNIFFCWKKVSNIVVFLWINLVLNSTDFVLSLSYIDIFLIWILLFYWTYNTIFYAV